jgi:hypothetical protein
LFPLQDWSYSDGYIGSMTSRSILICLVVRVGLGVGFLLALFLTVSLCNNAVKEHKWVHQENHHMIVVREVHFDPFLSAFR